MLTDRYIYIYIYIYAVLDPLIFARFESGQIYLYIVTVSLSVGISNDTKRGFVAARVLYKENAFAYLSHSLTSCGSPKAFTSTTIVLEM